MVLFCAAGMSYRPNALSLSNISSESTCPDAHINGSSEQPFHVDEALEAPFGGEFHGLTGLVASNRFWKFLGVSPRLHSMIKREYATGALRMCS